MRKAIGVLTGCIHSLGNLHRIQPPSKDVKILLHVYRLD
jgi:hypothetical protein